ncbi:Y-family DNA polymerase [Shewanella surugensis]|uniref:Y-family DNA polymerase n=1 Tax=Shewanella surugensis TaxID=212020 RepID=A0ABT0LI66_9GAMM|nr:Y-family DNA polymerase [Shewanella surugensis]MCL1126816.1 Y-family DNA polymerase [Shewanella surugensis]
MYALIDANAFYCSAEQVFRPEWRGKPIVVLSNNDGCVVAANRQAKDIGIPKFKPYFKVKALCDRHSVIALSSNYELYASLSSSMMEVIGRFGPKQHIYSIDESFLSFKHCYPAIPNLTEQAHKIRRAVWKETRLPVCVGIGATLTLAKVANHAAKKINGYNGVCHIKSETERQSILHLLKPDDVWGIGRQIAKKLSYMGIKNAFQLATMPPSLARKSFSIEVERTVRELNGEECKQWDEARADKKQIFSTRSMGEKITDKDALKQALSKHVGIAAAKARKQGSLCGTMLIFASNSPFDENPSGFKQTINFSFPTADSLQMTNAVTAATDKLFQRNVRYYKVGIGLLDLCSATNVQSDLFESVSDPRLMSVSDPRLMSVYDSLNARFGNGSIFLAAEGISTKWQMRRERLTPQYTTCWNDIPKIKC